MADDCSPHGWTVDTLETHLSSRIDGIKELLVEHDDRNKERFLSAEKAVQAALTAADKALAKAEMASERRFEGVNEFRGTLADQSATLLPRAEYKAEYSSMLDKLTSLTSRVETIESIDRGKAQGIGGVTAIVYGTFLLITAACAVIAVIITLMKH
jgi:hypothetical protein